MVHDISSLMDAYVHFSCGTVVKVIKSMSFFPSVPFSCRIVSWNRRKVLQPVMLKHAFLVLVCIKANAVMVPKF
jgi:hypothetical protein